MAQAAVAHHQMLFSHLGVTVSEILLKEDISVLNYPKNFVIMDTEDERDILLRIFSDMHITMREMTVQSAIDEVLEAKKMRADTYIDDIYRMNNEQLRERFNFIKDRRNEIFTR